MSDGWWPTGAWIGPAGLGQAVCAALGDVAALWRVGAVPASLVLNATALDDRADIDQLEDAYERALAGAEPPYRIISLVWDSWLGRGSTGPATARSAAAVGLARNWALRLAPTATTVNTIALPDGFPDAVAPSTAPVSVVVGIDDLAHVVRFFGHPANSYIIGQLVSLGCGDFVWSNHSL